MDFTISYSDGTSSILPPVQLIIFFPLFIFHFIIGIWNNQQLFSHLFSHIFIPGFASEAGSVCIKNDL